MPQHPSMSIPAGNDQHSAGRSSAWWARAIRNPAIVLVVPVLASAAAWAVPGASRALRGFGEREAFTLSAALILGCWYLLSVAAVWTGYKGGQASTLSRRFTRLEGDAFDTRFAYALTILATLGVGWVVIEAGGPGAFFDAFATSDANNLKEATGGEAGLATLRYTAALSAPVALHRFLSTKRGFLLTLWNVALLLATVSIASRLSLILAVVTFGLLAAQRPTRVEIRTGFLVTAGAALLALLTFFNYTRNAGYYRANGVDNPIQANVYEILTYLGTPFQASVGVATHFHASESAFADAPASPWLMLLPEFLRPDGAEIAQTGARYEGSVDIRTSLTTNSAFADLLSHYGPLGLSIALVMLIGAGVLIGHFARYESYLVATSGALLYAVADFWRIFLFDKGIIVYTAAAPIVVAALLALVAAPAEIRGPRRSEVRLETPQRTRT